MTVMTKRGREDNVVTYEHICDTTADLKKIEPAYRTLGSVAIVIQGDAGFEVYIANSNGEWINLTSSSSSDDDEEEDDSKYSITITLMNPIYKTRSNARGTQIFGLEELDGEYNLIENSETIEGNINIKMNKDYKYLYILADGISVTLSDGGSNITCSENISLYQTESDWGIFNVTGDGTITIDGIDYDG